MIVQDYKSSLIVVFPKPSWTDLLSSLHIKLHDMILPGGKTFESSNMYNLCMLDNYPNLQTVRIFDTGAKTFHFSKHIYLSLNRCKKLDNLTIKYFHGSTPNNIKEKISHIINELRGTWKEFTLGLYCNEYSEDYPWHISNPTITSFIMDVNNYESNHDMVFDFNKKVFRKLTLDDTGIYNPDLPQPFNLLKQHADNLTSLSIGFLAKKDQFGIFNGFKDLIVSRAFPNVVSLAISDYSDGIIPRGFEHENILVVKDSIAQYLAILFDLSAFGRFFVKTGDANETIRLLQKATSSSNEIKFSKKLFDLARDIPYFEDIYKCYDTHDNTVTEPLPCCRKFLNGNSIISTYFLFLLVFQQIEIPHLDILPKKILTFYLAVIAVWSELFLHLEKAFPKLKSLKLDTNVGMNELAMLPYLQLYYKDTLIPDLWVDGSEMDWNKLILPTYPYKGEWIRKTFQKCSNGIPGNFILGRDPTHQIKYLSSLCKK